MPYYILASLIEIIPLYSYETPNPPILAKDFREVSAVDNNPIHDKPLDMFLNFIYIIFSILKAHPYELSRIYFTFDQHSISKLFVVVYNCKY